MVIMRMGFQVDRTAVVVTRLGPWMLGCWEGVASGRAVVVRVLGGCCEW